MKSLELNLIDWKPGEKILWFGIGNPGRQDDGLGIRLIEELEAIQQSSTHSFPKTWALDSNYQLNAEDALLVSDYDRVVFVDATVAPDAQAPFEVKTLEPSNEIAFTTHEMNAGVVMALCDQLYGKKPKSYLLTIPGYTWDIGDQMSEGARQNLKETLHAIAEELLQIKSFDAVM